MSWLGNVTGRLYRGEVSFDFVGRQKLWYTISGLILVISIAALAIRGLDYSVDFKGGSVYQFSAPAATASQVTSAAANAGAGQDVRVQTVQPPGKPLSWQVQTEKLAYGQSVKVQDALARSAGLPVNKVSVQFVGPSWGSQISQKALEALIAFLTAAEEPHLQPEPGPGPDRTGIELLARRDAGIPVRGVAERGQVVEGLRRGPGRADSRLITGHRGRLLAFPARQRAGN
jgi:hypothetical protein